MSERRSSMQDKVVRGDVIKYIRDNISLDTFMKRTVRTADEACWGLCDKLNFVPAVEERPRWIPCAEALPEEDESVLITYRYKEGEGNTNNARIEITSYGQLYCGGQKVGDYKHWRSPFNYFESNYEVVAWMPLPEPYSERVQE